MNITYLLGAGASYNALPIIDELPERLKQFKIHVEDAKKFFNSFTNKPLFLKKEDLTLVTDEIDWLLEEMENHKTVDTLAKKFYVLKSREEDLNRLKKILIAYFVFEQSFFTETLGVHRTSSHRTKEMPDKRYDSFIATIISKERNNLSLDPHFKVVTWNYDSQFELAYKSYLEINELSKIQTILQSSPSFFSDSSSLVFDFNKFGIVRLNGLASFLNTDVFDAFRDLSNEIEIKVHLIGTIAHKLLNISNDELSLFTYSWETKEQLASVHSKKQTLFKTAEQIMAETNILVVIGYSFPNFNRSVDKILLSELKGLKKVYVQDVNAEEVCELIKSSFELFKWSGSKEFDVDFRTKTDEQVPVIPVKGVDQFFIPPEADI